MTIERSIWKRGFDENFSNFFPCPRCSKGRVRRGENPVNLVEPSHSKEDQSHPDWEIHWVQYYFTVMLECDNPSCGEIVAVSGRGGVDYFEEFGEFGEPQGGSYQTWLKPVSLFPAPPIFPIPKSFPSKVQEELRLAFQLFWTDRSASTSRLRTSLERVLDQKGIPIKNAKKSRLNLFDRIDLFEKASKNSDLALSMNALRNVGNIGTHGDEVSENDYFDLLDVYEDALLEIYEQKGAKLKAKKQSLIALKDT